MEKYYLTHRNTEEPQGGFLFSLFLTYLILLYLRPLELFFPQLLELRPMLFIWIVSFLGSLTLAIQNKNAAAVAKNYWLVAGFLAAIFLSQATKGLIGSGIDAISEFSASAFLFFLVSFNTTSIPRIRKACLIIAFSLITVSLFGIRAFHTGNLADQLVLPQRASETIEPPADLPPIPAEDTSGAYLWRVKGVGILSDPNDFAQALIMVLPFLYWLYKKGAWFRNLFVVGIPASILMYGVILSQSRGGILGTAALMVPIIQERLGKVKTLILGGGLMAAYLAVGMVGGRAINSKERSAEERIEAWTEGFQMLRHHPVFGVGFGNFVEEHYLTAHNSFVLCFSELGLFGYLFWCTLIVAAYKSTALTVRHAIPGSETHKTALILRSSLVGYLTCAWFLSRTYQPVLYCLLALCVASFVCARRGDQSQLHTPLPDNISLFKPAIYLAIFTMSAVQFFIFMHHA